MNRSHRLIILLLMAALTACGAAIPAAPAATSAPAAAASELTVFAAASLTAAFKEIGAAFGVANGGATVTFNFAGSDQLATQITQGAPADVFASANQKQMDVVINAGEIMSGAARTFVRNRLVVVYPHDNPAKLAALKDLANPGLKIVLANKSVPVGGYALDFLAKAQPYSRTWYPTKRTSRPC
jgi:molybdate transport system substrate-binding protein